MPAAAAVSLLLWASSYAAIRRGLDAYAPGQLVALRFLTASAVLGAWGAAAGVRPPRGRDLWLVTLAGATGIGVSSLALAYGEVTVTAGSASVLVNTAPVFTALLAAVLLRERLRARSWGGIAAGFSGAALIALGERGGAVGGAVGGAARGTALLLLSALAFALFVVLQKACLERYRPLELTVALVWAGTLPTLVFLPGLAAQVRAAPPSATAAVVYLGVGPAALAYLTWAYALDRASPSVLASSLYLIPAAAVPIAWVWVAELPHPTALVGAAVTLAGVALAGAPDARRPGRPTGHVVLESDAEDRSPVR